MARRLRRRDPLLRMLRGALLQVLRGARPLRARKECRWRRSAQRGRQTVGARRLLQRGPVAQAHAAQLLLGVRHTAPWLLRDEGHGFVLPGQVQRSSAVRLRIACLLLPPLLGCQRLLLVRVLQGAMQAAHWVRALAWGWQLNCRVLQCAVQRSRSGNHKA